MKHKYLSQLQLFLQIFDQDINEKHKKSKLILLNYTEKQKWDV